MRKMWKCHSRKNSPIEQCLYQSSTEELPPALDGNQYRVSQMNIVLSESLGHSAINGMPSSNPFLQDSGNSAEEVERL